MNTYSEYENMIVERLMNEGWDVSALPTQNMMNDARDVFKPLLYVIFTKSDFEETPNLGDFAMYEQLSFELFIHAVARDGGAGVFAVAEESIQRLLKWKVPDAASKISLSSFDYINGIQNAWQYVLKFSFTRVRVMREDPDEDFDYGKFKKITHNFDYKT